MYIYEYCSASLLDTAYRLLANVQLRIKFCNDQMQIGVNYFLVSNTLI